MIHCCYFYPLSFFPKLELEINQTKNDPKGSSFDVKMKNKIFLIKILVAVIITFHHRLLHSNEFMRESLCSFSAQLRVAHEQNFCFDSIFSIVMWGGWEIVNKNLIAPVLGDFFWTFLSEFYKSSLLRKLQFKTKFMLQQLQ